MEGGYMFLINCKFMWILCLCLYMYFISTEMVNKILYYTILLAKVSLKLKRHPQT